MKEALESISDFSKFLFLLVLYTGYLTWWASSVSSSLENNSEHIAKNSELILEHSRLDIENLKQATKLATKVGDIDIKVMEHDKLLTTIVEQHIKCSILIDQLIKRVDIDYERPKER